MIIDWMRCFSKDDTVVADESFINENESVSISSPLIADEDSIIIGKRYPFNNFYAWIDTANVNTSKMIVSYWDGSQWRAAVDVIDATSDGTNTLAQNGGVTFVPNRSYGWSLVEDTSSTSNTPSELQPFTIYDLYWIKITVSADLSAGSSIKRLFYAFTTTQVINSIDSDAVNYLTGLGQSSWESQIFTATKEVLADLKARRMLLDDGQLLSIDALAVPTAYRTLALIYFNLGEDYNNKYTKALKMYETLMRDDLLKIDQDNNAILEPDEYVTTNGRFWRV